MHDSLPAPGIPGGPADEEGDFEPLDESLIPEDLAGAPLDLDDDDLDEDEEDGGGEEDEEDTDSPEGEAAEAKPKARSKKRKGSDEDEEVEHPDTPVPSAAKMRKALDKAFAGQEDIDERMLDLMTQHARLLLETNRTMNVTAILDPTEIAVKHYLDSWRVTRMVPLVARTVLDLGAGGGGRRIARGQPRQPTNHRAPTQRGRPPRRSRPRRGRTGWA